MPNLPTLNVPAGPVWDRLMKIFNGDPVVYKQWLKAKLQQELESREIQAISDEAQAAVQTRMNELRGYLDGSA